MKTYEEAIKEIANLCEDEILTGKESVKTMAKTISVAYGVGYVQAHNDIIKDVVF